MLDIKISLLPTMEQEALERLYGNVWDAIEMVQGLGLTRTRPQDVTVLFPEDKMHKGLGEYLRVEVEEVQPRPEYNQRGRELLAQRLKELMFAWFPDVKFILVTARPANPDMHVILYDKE